MNNFTKLGRLLVISIKNIGKDPSKRFKRSYVHHLFRLFSHPIDALNDVKYEGTGSLFLANILVAIFFIEQVVSGGVKGYLFAREEGVSPIMTLATTVGFVFVWCICNWASCTLFDGEGTFKEIYIITAYTLLPMLIVEPFIMIFSNIASSDEAILISAIQLIGYGWTLLLEFLGMMVCQQFTVSKTIVLAIVTLLGILALAFIALLFFSISQQLFSFIQNLYFEIIL